MSTEYQLQRALSDTQATIARVDNRLQRLLDGDLSTPPLNLMWRAVTCHFKNTAQPNSADLATSVRPRDREAAAIIARAAVAPAQTTVAGWADELVQTAVLQWIDALAPTSVFATLAKAAIQFDFNGVGIVKVPGRSATPMVNGSFIGENQPIPVRRVNLTSITLTPKKIGVISEFTRELAKGSDNNVEKMLRAEVTRDTSITLDTVLIDTNPADLIRPAGLRNNVAGLTPSAAASVFEKVLADIGALIGALQPANRIALICNAVEAAVIGAVYHTSPVIVVSSANVPVGLLIAVDLDAFVSSAGLPLFDVSTEAVVHEEDQPQPLGLPGTPNVIAAPSRSLYQTDVLGVRQLLDVNWSMRRASGTAWMSGVTW